MRESETKYREAQRLAHIGSWYWDSKNDTTTGSDELLRIYGFDPETENMPDFKEQRGLCYPVEDWARINTAVQKTMETGVGYELDVRAVRNGNLIWVTTRCEAVRDDNNVIVGLRGTVQDITRRKLAEEALREKEEEFRTLADSIPNLAWWANGDGYLTWYNQRWYEYTGTTPKQMEGWGWQSVHDPNALPKVLERWNASIATGKPFEMEFPLLGADGVFRPFLTRVMPLKDSAGLVLRWFGTNTDISAQKLTEESLMQRTAELELANKELTSFIYSVAHDLRGPIRHMYGFSDLAMKDAEGKLGEKGIRYLSRIHHGAEKMSRLIDDLLNLSQISRQEIQGRDLTIIILIWYILLNDNGY